MAWRSISGHPPIGAKHVRNANHTHMPPHGHCDHLLCRASNPILQEFQASLMARCYFVYITSKLATDISSDRSGQLNQSEATPWVVGRQSPPGSSKFCRRSSSDNDADLYRKEAPLYCVSHIAKSAPVLRSPPPTCITCLTHPPSQPPHRPHIRKRGNQALHARDRRQMIVYLL